MQIVQTTAPAHGGAQMPTEVVEKRRGKNRSPACQTNGQVAATSDADNQVVTAGVCQRRVDARHLNEKIGRRLSAIEAACDKFTDGKVLIRVALGDEVAHTVEMRADAQRAVVVENQWDALVRLPGVCTEAGGIDENRAGSGVDSQHMEDEGRDDDKDAFVRLAPQLIERPARLFIKRQLADERRGVADRQGVGLPRLAQPKVSVDQIEQLFPKVGVVAVFFAGQQRVQLVHSRSP